MTLMAVVKKSARWGVQAVVVVVFSVGVVVLLLWLAGKFSPKVPMTPTTDQVPSEDMQGHVEAVLLESLPLYESAVGAVRAVHETTIGSKLLASVMEVNVTAGQKVRAGDVLIRLDDTDLKAKLHQAEAAVASIEATRDQAIADEKRYARLLPQKAVSQQEYEKIVAAKQTAEANLQQAKAVLNESQAALDWATIRSPIDGTIIDKKVEVGDMVSPGQILVTLFDPLRMQLVASVRESLVYQLQEGQDIGVKIDALDKLCTGTISEIVPESHAHSRSFQVKVTGPCPPGIYSGMFGRIEIPLGEEKVLLIPSRAVQHVGQLQLVSVVTGDRVVQRSIRTGRRFEDNVTDRPSGEEVEVLSGLQEGEEIVVPTATNDMTQEAAHD